MATTKLRSSSMNLHGVFHKSRVFDPTYLFEAKAKPMIQQKCLLDSHLENYADVENLYRAIISDLVVVAPVGGGGAGDGLENAVEGRFAREARC